MQIGEKRVARPRVTWRHPEIDPESRPKQIDLGEGLKRSMPIEYARTGSDRYRPFPFGAVFMLIAGVVAIVAAIP